MRTNPEETELIRVLLADDHAVLRAGLKLLLDGEPDMRVVGEAADEIDRVTAERDGKHDRERSERCTTADPAPNRGPVRRADLWTFVAAQEFTLISPAMHDEFLLQYQLPIMSKFGHSPVPTAATAAAPNAAACWSILVLTIFMLYTSA